MGIRVGSEELSAVEGGVDVHFISKFKCFGREVGHGDDVIRNVPNGSEELVVPFRWRTSDVRKEA